MGWMHEVHTQVDEGEQRRRRHHPRQEERHRMEREETRPTQNRTTRKRRRQRRTGVCMGPFQWKPTPQTRGTIGWERNGCDRSHRNEGWNPGRLGRHRPFPSMETRKKGKVPPVLLKRGERKRETKPRIPFKSKPCPEEEEKKNFGPHPRRSNHFPEKKARHRDRHQPRKEGREDDVRMVPTSKETLH